MNPALDKDVALHLEKDWSSVIKGKDIIIVGLQPWYFETGCNCKNMAMHFAKQNRVLYVNFPLKRKSYLAKIPDPKIEKHVSIIKNKETKLRVIENNIWELYPTALVESVNWLPSSKAFKSVNYFNNKRFARDIKKAADELGFKNTIVFNDNDVYNGYYLKEFLKPEMYIYYFRDFLQGYDYWRKHTSVLEPELIRKSDLVVANSQYYADYSIEYNKNSFYIGQGCSFEFFDHTKDFPVPDDIQRIASPIIGYIGALDSARLDLEIVRIIAEANPRYQVVLVGPEDDVFKQSTLHQIPNVHFLGGKPFNLLPAYVKAFDVCINPQLKNQITKGNYPLKIDEYLAMGKPVIATNTQAMEIFAAHTYLADTPGDYPALVERALAENNQSKYQERIAFAQTHTWENCMIALYKAIEISSKQKIQA